MTYGTKAANRGSRPRTRNESLPRWFSTSDLQLNYDVASRTTTRAVDTKNVYGISCTRTMDDWVTPGYAQRIANGEILQLPMYKREVDISIVENALKLRDYHLPATKFDFVYTGVLGNKIPFLEAPVDAIGLANIQTYVRTKALAKVGTTGFQGGVALAEFHKTVNMLAHPLSAVNNLLAYIKQVRQARHNLVIDVSASGMMYINGRPYPKYRPIAYRGPGRVVRMPKGRVIVPAGAAISGTVLVNNLGLRPMLMDVDAILNKIPLAHQNERNTDRAMQSDSTSTKTTSTYTRGVVTYRFDDVIERKISVRATIISTDHFSIARDFGITLPDLPRTAWELVPYSFVFDYFVNVGDFLDAFSGLANGNDVLMGCLVTTFENIATRKATVSSVASPYELTSPYLATSVRTYKETQRTFFGASDYGLAVNKTPLRPAAVQNLLSLICQMLTKIR